MLPSWAWSQGRQISLPSAILSSLPLGHLCQPVSPGIPFRALNLQTVFVRLTHHPCSTSEAVTAPTPHTPFARCHQGQCLRGDLPGAPLAAAVGAGGQRARAAGPWSASLALDCESSSATFPGGLGHVRFRFPAGEMGKDPCLTGLS